MRAIAISGHSIDQRSGRRFTLGGCGDIRIAPTVFHSESKLSGYEGVADAKLVRATVVTAIAHREVSIRNVYRQVLEDATARREATAQSRA